MSLNVTLKGPALSETLECTDNGDGTFGGSFRLTLAGTYNITIGLFGTPDTTTMVSLSRLVFKPPFTSDILRHPACLGGSSIVPRVGIFYMAPQDLLTNLGTMESAPYALLCPLLPLSSQFIEFVVMVGPPDASQSTLSVSAANNSVSCLGDFDLLPQPRDAFGNIIPTTYGVMSFSLNIAADTLGGISWSLSQNSSLASNYDPTTYYVYAFLDQLLGVGATRPVGNYSLTLVQDQAPGIVLASSWLNVAVGKANYSASVLLPGVYESPQAGTPVSIYLTLVDECANPVSFDEYNATLSVVTFSFVSVATADAASGTGTAVSDARFAFSTPVLSDAGGVLSITSSANAPSTVVSAVDGAVVYYFVKATFAISTEHPAGGTAFFPSDAGFQVLPGPFSPSNSTATFSGNAAADSATPLNLMVTLFDEFLNHIVVDPQARFHALFRPRPGGGGGSPICRPIARQNRPLHPPLPHLPLKTRFPLMRPSPARR